MILGAPEGRARDCRTHSRKAFGRDSGFIWLTGGGGGGGKSIPLGKIRLKMRSHTRWEQWRIMFTTIGQAFNGSGMVVMGFAGFFYKNAIFCTFRVVLTDSSQFHIQPCRLGISCRRGKAISSGPLLLGRLFRYAGVGGIG